MIRIFFIFSLCFSIFLSSSGQDIIVLKNGTITEALVKKIGTNNIEYVRFDNQAGPLYEISKSEIMKITYQNGVEDTFEEKTENDWKKGVVVVQSFFDERDSNYYKVTKIGMQIWMKENLQYLAGQNPCYSIQESDCNECGRYYSFKDALTACPKGWHLPSDEDWVELETLLGMNEGEAYKIGWRGTHPGQAHAMAMNGYSGLDLLMCGYAELTGLSPKNPKFSFYNVRREAYYWTSTISDRSNLPYIRHLKGRASIQRITMPKTTRLPVRCVKDQTD